jgi:hypothetical protein
VMVYQEAKARELSTKLDRGLDLETAARAQSLWVHNTDLCQSSSLYILSPGASFAPTVAGLEKPGQIGVDKILNGQVFIQRMPDRKRERTPFEVVEPGIRIILECEAAYAYSDSVKDAAQIEILDLALEQEILESHRAWEASAAAELAQCQEGAHLGYRDADDCGQPGAEGVFLDDETAPLSEAEVRARSQVRAEAACWLRRDYARNLVCEERRQKAASRH